MITRIYKTREEMGSAAAERVSSRIAELLKVQDTVNMIFAAAPSQNEFLAALLKAPVEWSRVRGFHMDEYTGLRPDEVQGFGTFLQHGLFDQAPFNDPQVADFADPCLVKVVELDEPCRQQQVNDGCFASLPEVPTHAITELLLDKDSTAKL